MKTTVTALITGVTGALVGGVATGILVYVSLSQERPTAAHSQPQPSTESIFLSNQDSPARVREHVTYEIDPTLFIQSVLEATQFASDFDQSVSMYLLLARAEETDLNRYINESFSISERNQRIAALSIIFARYGAVNPSEALERALALNQVTLQEKANVIRSIFNEWTVSDLEGASAAIENLPQQFQYAAISAIMWRSDFLSTDQRIQLAQQIGPNDAWIDNAVASIRSEAAKVDPRSAFYEQIRDTAHTQRRYTELFGIVRNWFEQEGVAILPEIHDALDNPNARRFVLQNLIWNAIGTKTATPVEILDVVTELPNKQDAQQATEHVFRSWSNLDPQKILRRVV